MMPIELKKSNENFTFTQFQLSEDVSTNSFALALLSNAHHTYENGIIHIKALVS